MTRLEWYIIAALCVWWVLPTFIFGSYAIINGHGAAAAALAGLIGCAMTGGCIGAFWARRRHGDPFEAAITGALTGALLGAAPISILILG